MSQLSRRQFVRAAAFATAGTRLVSMLPAAAAAGAVTAATARAAMPVAGTPGAAPVRWLDGQAPVAAPGTTWGMSWASGSCPADTSLALFDAKGRAVQLMRSWMTAITQAATAYRTKTEDRKVPLPTYLSTYLPTPSLFD